MTINRWMGFAVMSVLMVGLLTIWNPASHGQPPAAKSEVVWEYKTVILASGGDPERSLNELGQKLKGWELAAIGNRGSNEVFVFKRPKPELRSKLTAPLCHGSPIGDADR